MTDQSAPDQIENPIEAIQNNAKRTFNFQDKLKGRKSSTKTVLLFMDVPASRAYNTKAQEVRRAEAVVKGIESGNGAGIEDAQARLAELKNEAEELLKTSLENTLAVHLRAVPDDILKAVQREGRKAYALNDGTIPANSTNDHRDFVLRKILVPMVERVVDHEGAESGQLTLEDVEALQKSVEPAQWERVNEAVNELLFNDGLASMATDDPGF